MTSVVAGGEAEANAGLCGTIDSQDKAEEGAGQEVGDVIAAAAVIEHVEGGLNGLSGLGVADVAGDAGVNLDDEKAVGSARQQQQQMEEVAVAGAGAMGECAETESVEIAEEGGGEAVGAGMHEQMIMLVSSQAHQGPVRVFAVATCRRDDMCDSYRPSEPMRYESGNLLRQRSFDVM